VAAMLKMDKDIDLLIPRGSNSLVSHIKQNTTIPVLGHADGICHIYADKEMNAEKSAKITYESKTHYPAACNAVETLLVHRDLLTSETGAEYVRDLAKAAGTGKLSLEFRCCAESMPLFAKHLGDGAVAEDVTVKLASEADYGFEFLERILAVKAVACVDEAIAHINAHGSGHTDCVLTENTEVRDQFFASVDSADVFCNCSTRFADGFRFGFGAEVGISTNRIHARGPVGLEGLVTYKYRLYGNGQLVGNVKWAHEPIAHAAKRTEELSEQYAEGGAKRLRCAEGA